jgi:competence protein ComEA
MLGALGITLSIRLSAFTAYATPLDVNTSTASELSALPGLGDEKAAAIVDYRERHGAFHALNELDAVPGIGRPSLLLLRGKVAFGPPDPADVPSSPTPTAVSVLRTDLNRATAAELTALPGIGAARADAIVNDRDTNGPFRSCEDLIRVPGFGQATLAAIRDRCDVSR